MQACKKVVAGVGSGFVGLHVEGSLTGRLFGLWKLASPGTETPPQDQQAPR